MKRKNNLYVDIICGLLIILFVYAALNKFLEFEKFKVQVSKSPILTSITTWIVWGIPVLELVISVLLCITKTRFLALLASFTLMTMFTAYIYIIMHFSEYVPCSCGGVLQNMSWSTHFKFNLVFVILSLLGGILESKNTYSSRMQNIHILSDRHPTNKAIMKRIIKRVIPFVLSISITVSIHANMDKRGIPVSIKTSLSGCMQTIKTCGPVGTVLCTIATANVSNLAIFRPGTTCVVPLFWNQ